MAAVFKSVKDNDPNMIPLAANAMGTVATTLASYDELGDQLGVLPDYDNNSKVVNVFETAEYAQMLTTVRSWKLNGYIQQDAATYSGNTMDLVKSGRAFSFMWGNFPGAVATISRIVGSPMVIAPLGPNVVTTGSVGSNMYGILHNSQNPDKAMQFLNLLYTDKDIMNLIDRGIEGIDYVKKSDNAIELPPGVTPNNAYPDLSSMIGNQYLAYLFTTDDPNLWKEQANFTNQALKSKGLGFNFNSTPVKTEYATLKNVLDQYRAGLEDGSVDPDKALPEFIAKLKASGIDKVIVEKQKQFDDWSKTNK